MRTVDINWPAKEQKASREGYGEAIRELGKRDPLVVAIDADLASSTKSLKLRDTAPERFFYAGICEQSAIGTGVGLALSGKKVFVSSFAIFITGRAWEIIRQAVGYSHVPVTIVGSHSGIHTGEDGASAQATEDIATMRVIPNMHVVVAADAIQAREAAFFLADYNQPCYLRTNRNKIPVFYPEDYQFNFGKADLLRKGTDVSLVACGVPVSQALQASDALKKEGIAASVLNMHTIKHLDKDALAQLVKDTGAILTVEDHQIRGGLGGAVAEALAEMGKPAAFKRIGMNGFAESGKPGPLYEKYGLDGSSIAKAAKQVVKER